MSQNLLRKSYNNVVMINELKYIKIRKLKIASLFNMIIYLVYLKEHAEKLAEINEI